MKFSISDKFIVAFFVAIFGTLWVFSSRCYLPPKQYSIKIYDLLGKENFCQGIRTCFRNKQVATSFLKEYQKRYPHYDFIIKEEMPKLTERRILYLFLKKFL